jgi:hypothetical protein
MVNSSARSNSGSSSPVITASTSILTMRSPGCAPIACCHSGSNILMRTKHPGRASSGRSSSAIGQTRSAPLP